MIEVLRISKPLGRKLAALVVPFGLALSGLTTVAAPASAASYEAKATTEYAFVSAQGDYIGQGLTEKYVSPPATITLSGDASDVTMSVSSGSDYWNVEIAAPRGRVLEAGQYVHAERAAFRTGLAPGLDVSGDGRGCNEVYGSFNVNQIATDEDGDVTMLDATFVQHCESAQAPPLRGTVLYAATPLSYRYKSDPGDYIGQGTHRSYYGDTSTFGLGGNSASVSFSVSGRRDTWTADLSAPTGQQLRRGRYDDAQRFPDATHPGLDVYGDGRGCNQTAGSFRVLHIDVSGDTVVGFAAKFVQHCEGASPALHGVIHFHA